jgi:hypothetical protein
MDDSLHNHYIVALLHHQNKFLLYIEKIIKAFGSYKISPYKTHIREQCHYVRGHAFGRRNRE